MRNLLNQFLFETSVLKFLSTNSAAIHFNQSCHRTAGTFRYRLFCFCTEVRIRKGRPSKQSGGLFAAPWLARRRANPSSSVAPNPSSQQSIPPATARRSRPPYHFSSTPFGVGAFYFQIIVEFLNLSCYAFCVNLSVSPKKEEPHE